MKQFIACVCLLVLFCGYTWFDQVYLRHWTRDFSIELTAWMQTQIGLPWLPWLLTDIQFVMFLIPIMWYVFVPDRRIDVLVLASSVVIALYIASALKVLLQNPRPFWVGPESLGCPEGFGIPSGHTLLITVLSLSVVRFLPMQKRYLYPLLSLIIVLVALSRVWLGVHYLNQVIYSCILGCVLWYILSRKLNDLIRHTYIEKVQSIYIPIVSDLRSEDELYIPQFSQSNLQMNLWGLAFVVLAGFLLPTILYETLLRPRLPALEEAYWETIQGTLACHGHTPQSLFENDCLAMSIIWVQWSLQVASKYALSGIQDYEEISIGHKIVELTFVVLSLILIQLVSNAIVVSTNFYILMLLVRIPQSLLSGFALVLLPRYYEHYVLFM